MSRPIPRTLVYVIGACLLSGAVGLALAQAPVGSEPFKSNAVRVARDAYDSALSKARSEYNVKGIAAQKKYLETLELTIRQTTRDGDLAEANRLQAEFDLVAIEEFPDELQTLFGSWNMRWGDRAYTKYHIRKDGTVYRELPGQAQYGVLRRAGRDVLIEFTDKSLMRVNFTGRRLLLEYYDRKEDHPGAYPRQFGVGERIAA
jgi:hypothetical protein